MPRAIFGMKRCAYSRRQRDGVGRLGSGFVETLIACGCGVRLAQPAVAVEAGTINVHLCTRNRKQAYMDQTITAIYENGVLRPLTPLALPEHTEVEISLKPLPTG